MRNLQPAESGEGQSVDEFPVLAAFKDETMDPSDGRAEPSMTAKRDQHIRFSLEGWDFVNWPHRRAILHHSTEVFAP
jgi:hypothetical protein